MQDSLKSTMHVSNISVQLDGTRRAVRKFFSGEPVVIPSPVSGGSNVTISVNRKDSGSDMYALVIKGNPIGFLSGQNVYGTCNMPELNIALFERLHEMGVLQFTTEQWNMIRAGDYQINEVAFAQYFRVADAAAASNPLANKIKIMSYIKRLYAAALSNADQWTAWPISVHMYPGAGMILRRREQTLCIYDKELELSERGADTGGTTGRRLRKVSDKLRFEATLKYNWLQSRRLLTVKNWQVTDWSQRARELVLGSCQTMKLEYVLSCPNIFDRHYAERFSPADRAHFLQWMDGEQLPARVVRNLRRRYGLDTEISAEAHQHILFARLEPHTDVRALLSGNPAGRDRALRQLRHTAALFSEEDRMARSLLPLERSVVGSGPRSEVAALEQRAGMGAVRTRGRFQLKGVLTNL